MPSIAEIRKKYPSTQDLSDIEIVKALSDSTGIDIKEVASDFGVNHSDAGWEWESAKSNYASGLAHIAGALGSSTAKDYASRKNTQAGLERSMSSAPQSFDEMEVGKNGLAYVRQGAIGSVPYMAEAAGFAAADALTGGALTPAIIARYGSRVAPLIAKNAIASGISKGLTREAATDAAGRELARSAMIPAATYPSSLGDVLGNQYEQAGDYNLPAAAALAVPYAAANAVGIEGAMARGVPATLKNAVKRGGATGAALRAAGSATELGAQEAGNETFQEAMNQAGRVAVDPNAEMFSPEAQARYKESAIMGGLLGAIPGGAHGAVSPKAKPNLAAAEQESSQGPALALPPPVYTGTPSSDLLVSEVDRQRQIDAAQANADAIYADRAQFEASRPQQETSPGAAAVQQMQSIAAAPDFDRLSDSPVPDVGAPMVSVRNNAMDEAVAPEDMGSSGTVTLPDGSKVGFTYAVVDAGNVLAPSDANGRVNPAYASVQPGQLMALNNSRTAGLQEAYARGTATQPGGYAERLVHEASRFGLSPEAVSGKSAPMLVRMYDDTINARPDFARQLNRNGPVGMSAQDVARNDAARLPSLSNLVISQDGNFDPRANAPFVQGWLASLPQNERASVTDGAGNLSPAGLGRLRNAVIAKAYGDNSVFGRLVESFDGDMKNVGQALVKAAPKIAKVRELIASGVARSPEIGTQIDQAVNELIAATMLPNGMPPAGQGRMSPAVSAPAARAAVAGNPSVAEFPVPDVAAQEGPETPVAGIEPGGFDPTQPLELVPEPEEPKAEPGRGAHLSRQQIDAPKKAKTNGKQAESAKVDAASDQGRGDQRSRGKGDTPDRAGVGSGTRDDAAAPVPRAGTNPSVGDAGRGDGALSTVQANPVDAAAHDAATSPSNDLPEPSQAQKEANNYRHGHLKISGLDISIENPEGSTRSGIDPGGRPWSVRMKSHYGYLRQSEGRDGDHVDVFVKPGTAEDYAGQVFVIDQKKPGNGHFDEHKVMLGWDTEESAVRAYKANYTRGWDGIRAVTPMGMGQFKQWIQNGDTKAPVSAQENQPFRSYSKERAEQLSKRLTQQGLPSEAYPHPSGDGSYAIRARAPESRAIDAGTRKRLDSATTEIRGIADKFKAEFKGVGALDIRVVGTIDDIPVRFRPSRSAEGVYHDDAGLIYLVADNLMDGGRANAERAFQVLMHETVGHYGIAAMMGDRFRPILKHVMRVARDPSVKEDIYGPGDRQYVTVEAVKLRYPEATDAEVAQEVMARMAETENQRLRYRHILAIVRQWFRDAARAIGIKVETTMDELNDLIAKASAYMRAGRNLEGAIEPMGLAAASNRVVERDRTNIDTAMRRMEKFIDAHESGQLKPEYTQVLGSTPTVLRALGAQDLPLQIDGKTVLKILDGKHSQTMTAEVLRQLPEGLYNPIAVFDSADALGRPGKLLVTELSDRLGNPVIAAVHLGKAGGRYRVNDVASAYGLESAPNRSKVSPSKLEYVRNEKSLGFSTTPDLNTPMAGVVQKAGDSNEEGSALLRQSSLLKLADVVQQARNLGANILTEADVVKSFGPRYSVGRGMESRSSSIKNQPIQQAWKDPNELTRWDSFVRTMQDKMIDTKAVVAAIRAAGVAIKDSIDPYLQETLYHGRAAKRVADFADNELRPLLVEMQARQIGRQELEDYLWARHAAERNAQIAKVNPKLPDGGSGLTDQQAKDILAGKKVTVDGRDIQIDPGKARGYQALAKKIDAITKETTDTLVRYGLETQETVNAWRTTYANYVPLMRDMEADDNYSGAFNLGLGTGQGFNVRGSAAKRAMGSERGVVDILANVAMQRERAIVRGEKNRVAQALYGLAVTAPNPDFWLALNPDSVKDPQTVIGELIQLGLNPADAQNIATEPKQRYVDPNTGMVMERINPQLRSRGDVLSVRVNGQDRFVMFSSNERAQQMVRNLKNLDAETLGFVTQYMAVATRWFSSMNTQFNPVFGLTNGVRDFGTAALNLSGTPLKDHKSAVLIGAASALRGIYSDLRAHRKGEQPTSKWALLYEEFANEGGQTGYRDMFATSRDRAEALEKELKHAGKGASWLSLSEKRSPLFGWLSDYNTAIENAVRVSAYAAAKNMGMSKQQAAALAKELTVNFNRKGLAATQMGAMYAFFNAAVQGTARIAQTMVRVENGKPQLTLAGRKILYGGMLLGVIQALALAAAGYDDKEPPQFVREKNFIIPLPDGKYFSIPYPLGYHVIPGMGRIATELVLSGFKNPGQRLIDMASMFMDAFNPVGGTGGSLTQMLAPTVVDPLVALSENKDWTGKSIYREDFNKMHPTAGWTRTKDTASGFSKFMAYGINYITGGGKYEIGLLSPTPDQIDYLIGQATGGVGRESLKLWQAGSAEFSGEELPMYKVPVVGRFVGETTGQASESSKFYENLKRIGEHKSALEEMKDARDNKARTQYLMEHPDARMVKAADTASREIGYLKRQKRDMMERGESKERIRLKDAEITARIKLWNEKLREK